MSSDRHEAVVSAVVKATKAYVRSVGVHLAELGLQPGQDILLSFLWKNDGLSASEMVERLHVEPPTVTKSIARLEKQGLVTRKRDAKDARVSRVFLTPRGKKLREPVQKIWAAVRAEAFAGMSDDDLDALLRLASAMRDNVLRSLGEPALGARKK